MTARSVADPRARVVRAGRDALGEGPVWDDRTATLHRVDLVAGAVLALSDGTERRYHVGRPVGCVALPADGAGLLLALPDGFGHLDLDTGHVRLLARVPDDGPGMRFNDGGCDPAGRFLAGRICDLEPRRPGTLYRYEPPAGARPLLDGIQVSNGCGWDATGTTFYFIDSLQSRVDAFDYDDAGQLSRRRTAVDLTGYPGIPDGMTIDAEDRLWVAFWRGGAVRRFDPGGRLLDEVRLPVLRVTSCCLGGPDLATLLITTARGGLHGPAADAEPLAGAVFGVDVDVPGVPAGRWHP